MFTYNLPFFTSPSTVGLLRGLRVHRVLFHIAAARVRPVLHVLVGVPADFVRGAERWPGRRCGDERAKRRLPGAGDVRAVPAILRLLRVIRLHSDLLALDHLPVVHPVRLRGHRAGHILVRAREAQVPPGILPLPFAKHNARRAGHGRRQLYTGHRCLDRYIHSFAHCGVRFLELEIALVAINGANLCVSSNVICRPPAPAPVYTIPCRQLSL